MSTNTLADTHCHLDFEAFDGDRGDVLQRAIEKGIQYILNPGVDLLSSRDAVRLAENNQPVFAAVGVHPNSAVSWDAATPGQLEEILLTHVGYVHDRIKAIGEIGLDYYRDRAPREVQRRVFMEQLKLAARLGLPVVIHNREATADLLEILADWSADLYTSGSPLAGNAGVLHSYSGDEESAHRAIEMGFFIGITGPVTFHNARCLAGVVSTLPVERLLVETDAPFLTPHPHRGKRNEPAYVSLVVEKIAELKKLPVPQVAEFTTGNARRLFKW